MGKHISKLIKVELLGNNYLFFEMQQDHSRGIISMK